MKQIGWKIPGPFSHSKTYLVRYFLAFNLGVFCLNAVVKLLWFHPAKLSFHFKPSLFLFTPLAMYLGALSAIFIHNATHRNFRPIWMNRFVGELCGLHQLYGFQGWKLSHLVHHRFPDHPELDPHPPHEFNSPLTYFVAQIPSIRKCLFQFHTMLWGTTPETRIIWWVSDFLAALMMFQCAAFWLMLLGSSGFLVWFIPSYLSAFALFVYLNYYTHIMDKDGSPVVLNRNDGLFKLGNQLLFGVFFHKNHHDRASLFNPQTS